MKKFLIVLLVIVCIGLGAGIIYLKSSEDKEGPVITFAEDKNDKYTSDMTTEDLLEDVSARDNKDGDVTDSLTVETIYSKNDGKQVAVIFVAKDKSNNVTKKEFTMEAENGSGEDPQLGLIDNKDLEDSSEGQTEDSENQSSTESEETAASDSALKSEENEEADSTGSVETKEEEFQKLQESKIDQLSPEAPKIYLTTYYTEISAGSSLEQISYVKDIQDDTETTSDLFKKIQITGSVDTNTPGVYELTYHVVDEDGNTSNEAVLTVEVK